MKTTTTPESRGQLAYTAYCKALLFKSAEGEDLPPFYECPPEVQQGWISAANLIWDLATTGKAAL